jgi:hypothetical protein
MDLRRHALLILLAGCGGAGSEGPHDLSAPSDFATTPICDDNAQGDAGPPATMAEVQRVFDSACVGCHCCGDPLDLTSGKSHDQTVGRVLAMEQNVDESCGGPIVTPGSPSASYLYQKIHGMPCAGNPMPLNEFEFVPLAACQQDLVRRWILAGAPR